jgi:predicted flap endonuclease-1-like 5' DNA nuclease
MGILLNTARAAARDDILSVRDVGNLLSKALQDGEISVGERIELEKVKTELADKMSPNARTALDRFLGLGDTFDGNLAGKIFGVTVAEADKLEKAGVSRLSDLMLRARTPDGRKELASETRINAARITDFAERADLARIIGIGNKYGALLHGAGVRNMGELAAQEPAALRRKVLDFMATDEGKAITNRRPSMQKVETWIARAKELPQVMHYTDASGPNFTKAAFDSLSDDHKALLIWGVDVRLSDTSVFDASKLKVDVPRRKPAEINACIRNTESSGLDGRFESVHLSSVERVRAGNETLGYRLTFDVAGQAETDYEGASGDDTQVEGWISMALDVNGKVLGTDEDVWPGGNHEG